MVFSKTTHYRGYLGKIWRNPKFHDCHLILGIYGNRFLSLREFAFNDKTWNLPWTCCLLAFYIVAPGLVVIRTVCKYSRPGVGRFLSQILYLSSYAFLRKRRSFALRKLYVCLETFLFLAATLSSLCFSCSMYRFIPRFGHSGTTWFKCSWHVCLHWIVIWHMWNADLTPREGRNSKINSSRAGSLFLALFSSPARVCRPYPRYPTQTTTSEPARRLPSFFLRWIPLMI